MKAELTGRRIEGVVTLPRAALRGLDQVLVVDDDDRLEFRDVNVLRAGDDVVIDDGLAAGERVCLTVLDTPVPGMAVRVSPDAPQHDAESGPAEGARS